MVWFFIIKGFITFAVKTNASFFLLDDRERNLQHVASLAVNLLACELTAIIAYQFIFYSYIVNSRFEVFVADARHRLNDLRFQIPANLLIIRDLANLQSKLMKALEIINETFSIEVSLNFNRCG